MLRTGDEIGLQRLLDRRDQQLRLSRPVAAHSPRPGRTSSPRRPPTPLIEIPRAQIAALAVDGLESIGENGSGAARARRLLETLRAQTAAAVEPQPAIKISSDSPVVDFAPEVVLTRNDPSFPTSADFFLENSALEWHHDGCTDHAAAPSARSIRNDSRGPIPTSTRHWAPIPRADARTPPSRSLPRR